METRAAGTPSRYAMVGARSIERRPFATTFGRMEPHLADEHSTFTLAARFLDVQTSILAEERRAREERAGRRGVNWYGGYAKATT